jgi:hypothetical protein
MGGRHTTRQVASRVQKHFEKVKFFGVNVERADCTVQYRCNSVRTT